MTAIESSPQLPPTRHTCAHCTTTFMCQEGDQTGIMIIENNVKITERFFSSKVNVKADGKIGFLVPCPRCHRECLIVPSQPGFPIVRDYVDPG